MRMSRISYMFSITNSKSQIAPLTKLICIACVFLIACSISMAQLPQPALVGYWHNWDDGNAPYLNLTAIDSRYNVIDVSFAVPQSGTDYKMEFVPDQVSQAVFISQLQTLQSQGKKILISVGGATAPVSLDNITERDTFIATMNSIINTYGFDGIDIDLEGSSLSVSGGTITAPADAKIIHLIEAIQQIKSDYFASHNKPLLLTMAPETAFVQGGMSAYGGIWGAYLPVIEALKDSIDLLHVQLYNSGSMYGIDGGIYTQGTADFIVAMTEAVIQGFTTSGGNFSGLPANKVAIGLPACVNAAGGGFTDTATVSAAIRYLMGTGPQPGSYQLVQNGGYPSLGGMMTWSINWDAVNTCGPAYGYASNYESIFGTTTGIEYVADAEYFKVFPNPANEFLQVLTANTLALPQQMQLFDATGRLIKTIECSEQHSFFSLQNLEPGMYFLRAGQFMQKFIRK